MDEQQIFCAAIEIHDLETREVFLCDACGQDEEMLARINELLAIHDRVNGVLDRPVDGIASVQERIGGAIGPFRLIRQIGEGGFGVVLPRRTIGTGATERSNKGYQGGDGHEAGLATV